MLPAFYEAPLAYNFTMIVLFTSIGALYWRDWLYKLSLYPFGMWQGRELYRLFTSLFVHVGVLHLIANAFFGMVFIGEVEYMLVDDFGAVHGRLLLIVLIIGIAGTAGSASVYKHRHEYTHTSAGSSALIFGLVMFYLFYLPADKAVIDDSELPSLYSYQLGMVYFAGVTAMAAFKIGKAAPIHWYGALAGGLLAMIIGLHHWQELAGFSPGAD